jgi:hypothetical protein
MHVRAVVVFAPSSNGERGMNRILVILGTVILAIGLLWPWVRRLPLFRLPGDIVIDRPGFRFFFPITTMLIVSVVVSVLAWLFRR